jgi:Flp pilus assembly CpaF family ATPase
MSERNSAYPPEPMPDPARLPLFNAPTGPKTSWSANGHQTGGVALDRVDGVGSNGHRAASPWDVPGLPAQQPADQAGAYQPGRADWQLVRELRLEATTRLAEAINAEALDAGARQQRGRSIIADIIKQRVSSDISAGREPWEKTQRDWLRKALDDALFKLGRLQPLLDRDDVENIIITGHNTVWLDLIDGSLERAHAVADSDEELIEFLRWVANRFRPQDNERPFNESVPKLHLSLAWNDDNGEPMRARLAATAFVTVYPVVVIRRHRLTRITLEDLVAKGMLTQVTANFLRACVRAGKSIVVSGPQGAGKTTLIRALCACIDFSEKIGTFETEYELFLHEMPDRHSVVIPWEARPGSTEVDAFGRRAGEFTLGEAIDDSFRFTLSRQIVGEVRGKEIWAMIKAMESGSGSISSTHGKNARQTMDKLVTCAMEEGESFELATLKLAQTVDLVVQIGLLSKPDGENRWSRTRWVSEVALVEPGDAGYNLDSVFESGFGTTVATPSGTPIKKGLLNELQYHGFDLAAFQREMGARGVQPS